MKKTFSFGKVDFNEVGRKINLVTVDVELKDTDKGPEFTASGDVRNKNKTDIICGGQCLDELYEIPALRSNDTFKKIYNLWRRNHLNGMHAGTEAQENYIKEKFGDNYPGYTEACEALKEVNLYEDSGYRYGSSWLYRPISEEDMKMIKELLGVN